MSTIMNSSSLVEAVLNRHVNRGHNSREVMEQMDIISDNTGIMKEATLPRERQMIFTAMANDRLKETLRESITSDLTMTEDYAKALESEFKYAIHKVKANGFSPLMYEGYDSIIESIQRGVFKRSTDSYTLSVIENYYDDKIDKLESHVVEKALENMSVDEGDHTPETVQSNYVTHRQLQALESYRLKKKIANFILTENNTVEEDLEEFTSILNEVSTFDNYVISTESWKKKVKDFSFDVEAKARKAASSMNTKGKDVKRVTQAGVKATKHFTQLAVDVADDIEDKVVGRRKDEVIESKYRRKVMKLLRYVIANTIVLTILGSGATGLVIAALGTLVGLHLENKADESVHKELIRDLEVELRITKEKIGEAERRGDNKAKYQLIRIEEAIIDDLKRLKRGMKRVEGRSQTKRVRNSGGE